MNQLHTNTAIDWDAIHKLPRDWRYFNISVLWIPYYRRAIRVFYNLRVRHELVTLASILSGLAAAVLIAGARSLPMFVVAAILVHLKDLFDSCDGALARLTGTGHRLGRFLDTIGDGVVFTAWIAAAAWRAPDVGLSDRAAVIWGIIAWVSLFLQCSYFNFHQLHYIGLAGARLTSRLDEREETGQGPVAWMARIYDLWFGWQDRLLAAFDRWLRLRLGIPDTSTGDWYGHRGFMVANSALCFGTQALVLILCLMTQRPFWFLPAIAIGLNLYWLGIVLARMVVFRRGL